VKRWCSAACVLLLVLGLLVLPGCGSMKTGPQVEAKLADNSLYFYQGDALQTAIEHDKEHSSSLDSGGAEAPKDRRLLTARDDYVVLQTFHLLYVYDLVGGEMVLRGAWDMQLIGKVGNFVQTSQEGDWIAISNPESGIAYLLYPKTNSLYYFDGMSPYEVNLSRNGKYAAVCGKMMIKDEQVHVAASYILEDGKLTQDISIAHTGDGVVHSARPGESGGMIASVRAAGADFNDYYFVKQAGASAKKLPASYRDSACIGLDQEGAYIDVTDNTNVSRDNVYLVPTFHRGQVRALANPSDFANYRSYIGDHQLVYRVDQSGITSELVIAKSILADDKWSLQPLHRWPIDGPFSSYRFEHGMLFTKEQKVLLFSHGSGFVELKLPESLYSVLFPALAEMNDTTGAAICRDDSVAFYWVNDEGKIEYSLYYLADRALTTFVEKT